jgi:putative oxidoreductase
MNWLNKLLWPLPPAALVDRGLLVLRLLAGFALLRGHGYDKVVHFEQELLHIPDPLGIGAYPSLLIAIFSDVLCAGLVMAGALTRPAAAGVLGTTLVGLLVVHWPDPWPEKDIPFIYSAVYLFVLLVGPGRYSVDYWLQSRWTRLTTLPTLRKSL